MIQPEADYHPLNGSPLETLRERLWPYAVLGIFLGFVFTRGEVVSWFRIHEMFRFHAFHMYGIIGSAVLVGATGVWLIKRLHVRSLTHRPMEIPSDDFKAPGYQYWLGGTVFGLGWGLLGAARGGGSVRGDAAEAETPFIQKV